MYRYRPAKSERESVWAGFEVDTYAHYFGPSVGCVWPDRVRNLGLAGICPERSSVSGPSGPRIPWPHPFLLAGLGVNGAGYSSLSGNLGGGLRIDTTHLIWTASAGYDTARKANDNTIGNVSGHSRSL